MRLRWTAVAVIVAGGLTCPSWAEGPGGGDVSLTAAEPAGPDLRQTYGMICKPMDREQTYAFAEPDGRPAIRRTGKDRYEITFTATARCDATVVIEDGDGRVVRHLASGVLGENAPEPFTPGSLSQKLLWNGKDDMERYVRDPAGCSLRVSLGLKPTLDRIIGWHPKDTTTMSRIASLGADAGGVYVLEPSARNKIKVFDHKGDYVRTIAPVAADTIGRPEQKIPMRTLQISGRRVPSLIGEMGQEPFQRLAGDATFCMMAVANGWIVLPCDGNAQGGNYKRLVRFRTDGTTGGLDPLGKQFARSYRQFNSHCEVCFSPDGKWIYVSGLGEGPPNSNNKGPHFYNSVLRFAFDDTELFDQKAGTFFGEGGGRGITVKDSGRGDDDNHLDGPAGVATDAAGNLYVCDYGNNRLTVVTPDGHFLKKIPIKSPRQVAVSPKTGEIYVLSFRAGRGRVYMEQYSAEAEAGFEVTKLKGLADPKVVFTRRFDASISGKGKVNYWPIFCVDFWADPVTVWVVRNGGRIQLWADKGGELAQLRDFYEEVKATGLRPHMIGYYKMSRLVVDPTRDVLYASRTFDWMRVDPNEGRHWKRIKPLPGYQTCQELNIGDDGLMYSRSLTYLGRFDPERMVGGEGVPHSGEDYDLSCRPSSEVPFDYGEPLKDLGLGDSLAGAILIPAQKGANSFDTGFDVTPTGQIVCMVKNLQDAAQMGAYGLRGKGCYVAPLEEDRFRPAVYPGRPWYYEELVWHWDSRGELLGNDLVGGLPNNSEGVRMDLAGRLYVGVGYHQNVDGKPHRGGAVARFKRGGRIMVADGKPAPLAPLPDAPPDFLDGSGRSGRWAVGMYWSYPGYDQTYYVDPVALGYPCLCANCRFDTDDFGRCFIPKAYQFTVGVVDANGNRICEVGRYGNADSGRGADSTAKAEADSEISLAGCSYVATATDRWLYLMDDGNGRIVRVKLGYHAEKRAAVPGE